MTKIENQKEIQLQNTQKNKKSVDRTGRLLPGRVELFGVDLEIRFFLRNLESERCRKKLLFFLLSHFSYLSCNEMVRERLKKRSETQKEAAGYGAVRCGAVYAFTVYHLS